MAPESFLDHPRPLPEQNWPAEVVPLVSILCITYNHEKFIEDCLRGFLMQETSFPVEIIIHDDASTDGTRRIVQHYGNRYPQLLRTVFQENNQYSTGKKPSLLAVAHASGEYVALCEGDDYWIHPQKLELQISRLRENDDCDLCFHAALAESSGTDICDDEEVIGSHGGETRVFGTGAVITGDGSFCPTASLVLRRRVYRELPTWYFEAPVGDYYIQIIASASGGAVYLPEPMSVYRTGIAGSWSETISRGSTRIPFILATVRALHEADLWLNGRYHKEFAEQMAKYLGLLGGELALRPELPVAAAGAKAAVRELTLREKWARFQRQARSIGFSRAVMFALGHRLFLLGNRMKRQSAVTSRSAGQL